MESSPEGLVTYSLEGPDASSFQIDPNTGEVRLREVSDFETKDSYDITVVATGSNGQRATQQLSVSVNDVVTEVTGRVLAGPVTSEHGLTAELYGADGVLLGTSEVDAEGNYKVIVPDDYTGPVLVRIADRDDGDDYLHEGSGEGADLTSDLRALGHVGAGESATMNVNPLSEILTRMVLGDAAAPSVDGVEEVAQESIEEAKQNLSDALGLSSAVDLNAHATQAVNEAEYDDASAETQALAAVLRSSLSITAMLTPWWPIPPAWLP